MKLSQLRELVREVMKEEQDYQDLFKAMLDKTGKSIPDMSDEEKKAFFNAVDKAYKAKSEGKLKESAHKKKINEMTDVESILYGLVVATGVSNILYATGFTDMAVDKIKEKWRQLKNDYQYNYKIKPIVDRLKKDSDLINSISKINPRSRKDRKNAKELILSKLKDNERQYLHKIFRDIS